MARFRRGPLPVWLCAGWSAVLNVTVYWGLSKRRSTLIIFRGPDKLPSIEFSLSNPEVCVSIFQKAASANPANKIPTPTGTALALDPSYLSRGVSIPMPWARNSVPAHSNPSTNTHFMRIAMRSPPHKTRYPTPVQANPTPQPSLSVSADTSEPCARLNHGVKIQSKGAAAGRRSGPADSGTAAWRILLRFPCSDMTTWIAEFHSSTRRPARAGGDWGRMEGCRTPARRERPQGL